MAAITSIKTGDWSDPTTWNTSTVPTTEDSVTISSGNVITIDENVSVSSLTNAGSGHLNLQGSDSYSISMGSIVKSPTSTKSTIIVDPSYTASSTIQVTNGSLGPGAAASTITTSNYAVVEVLAGAGGDLTITVSGSVTPDTSTTGGRSRAIYVAGDTNLTVTTASFTSDSSQPPIEIQGTGSVHLNESTAPSNDFRNIITINNFLGVIYNGGNVIESASSGGWSSSAVWSGGNVPSANDTVLLISSHIINVDQDIECGSVVKYDASQLVFSGSQNREVSFDALTMDTSSTTSAILFDDTYTSESTLTIEKLSPLGSNTTTGTAVGTRGIIEIAELAAGSLTLVADVLRGRNGTSGYKSALYHAGSTYVSLTANIISSYDSLSNRGAGTIVVENAPSSTLTASSTISLSGSSTTTIRGDIDLRHSSGSSSMSAIHMLDSASLYIEGNLTHTNPNNTSNPIIEHSSSGTLSIDGDIRMTGSLSGQDPGTLRMSSGTLVCGGSISANGSGSYVNASAVNLSNVVAYVGGSISGSGSSSGRAGYISDTYLEADRVRVLSISSNSTVKVNSMPSVYFGGFLNRSSLSGDNSVVVAGSGALSIQGNNNHVTFNESTSGTVMYSNTSTLIVNGEVSSADGLTINAASSVHINTAIGPNSSNPSVVNASSMQVTIDHVITGTGSGPAARNTGTGSIRVIKSVDGFTNTDSRGVGTSSTNGAVIYGTPGEKFSYVTGKISTMHEGPIPFRIANGAKFTAALTDLISSTGYTAYSIGGEVAIDEADIRHGVQYQNQTRTGSMYVPDPGDVALNVPVDHTIGTVAPLLASDVATVTGTQISTITTEQIE